ncbi:hypothetical protein TREMEDRAFT_58704 [Tremella mesenterica DSM 1558]|uniref:uncharacterized protein n=1 Tax=Tremella mesenterica (strain ATCC 24925 / CBS 8224 / DSM 1558 / NBRC 9311 / NRRL Y-6157 / RJB 2259-6 / UBC 559-6) TaxID=578456 RepID=UPI0003F492E3|nr:uncharacterized protein TREMEDRAFT_58704 [Tremella mesenterica DSM 1558]EIW72532.1 hypothetical protein TREMEDRAFT_58704 [Tremella mesenterica DSM 1558]
MSTLLPDDPKSIPSTGSNKSALRIETGKDTSTVASQLRPGFWLNPNDSSSSIPDSPAPVTPDDPPTITLSGYDYPSTKKTSVQDPIDCLREIEPECTNCAVLPDAGSKTVYYLRTLRDTMDYLQTALEEDPASQEMPRSHGLTEEQIIEARKDLNVYAAGIATNVLVTYRWYNFDRPPSRRNLRLVIERALTLSRFGPDDGSEAEQQAISWFNSERAKKERARFWSVIEPFWPHVESTNEDAARYETPAETETHSD